MDFSFTEEDLLFQTALRSFLSKKLFPRAPEIDSKGEIPSDVLDDLASQGLLGITISPEYGGQGAGFVTSAIAAEEIARADISMATAVYYLVEAGWGFLFERYATKKAKEEILPDVTAGRKFLGIASTEPSGGSDIASMTTTLTKDEAGYTVKGEKAFISGVSEAASRGGGYVALGKTAPELKHKGMSLFYLPVKDTPGVSVSAYRQMGRSGISTGSIRIDGAKIPSHYLIGEEGRGFYYAMEGFNCARTLVAAACIGAAGRALDEGVNYLKERKAFGQELSKFQGIQFQLAEAWVKFENARLLVYRAAWMCDEFYSKKRFSFREINKAVAVAKLYAPTAAFEIIKDAMIWLGAYGYTTDAGLERGLRGVTSYLVGAEGAQNIMRSIIARELLGEE